MRIGIDCRTILNPGLGEVAGVGHYTYFLVKHLLEIDKENEYVLFFDYRMPDAGEFEQANTKIWRFPFSQYKKFLPFSYSHMLITAMILKNRLDVFHSPANVIPLSYPKTAVITVHDLAIYKNPAWFPGQIFSTKLLVPQSLKRAKHIIAVSESTKRDIQRIFSIPASKITVIYEAPFVQPINVKDRNVDVVKKYRLNHPFLLFVGTIDVRKNIGPLVRAFTDLRKNPRFKNIELLLAGGKGHKADEILEDIRPQMRAGAVRYLGYTTHNEKLALYRKAEGFIFPSLYEGFGLPVVEAMRLGVPVITSNVSSLPEIAGDAALLVDPSDGKGMTKAMAKLLSNPALRTSLVRRGHDQAKKFDWEKAASETLAVYTKAVRPRNTNNRRKRSAKKR